MTVDVTRAVCPSCGGFEHYTVHIRSDLHKDLVCRGCASDKPSVMHTASLGQRHLRHPFPPAFSPKAAGIGDGPAATGIPNPVLRPGRRTPRKVY